MCEPKGWGPLYGAGQFWRRAIPYTANGSDVRRAIRNAEFLARFTGKRSFAVVSGLYRDDLIRDSIESGKVYWQQRLPEQLDVD